MPSLLSLGALLLPLFPTTLAQSSSRTFFFLDGFDAQPLAASVITADPSTTSFQLSCPSTVSANDCGVDPPITVVHVPGADEQDVWKASISPPGESWTFSYSCSVGHGTQAVCAESNGGQEANFPGLSTTTYEGASVQDMFLPVTITAGLEKLASATESASSGSTATSESETGTVTSGSATGTVPASTGKGATSAGSATPTAKSSGSERLKMRWEACAVGFLGLWMLS
ncbi:MAG: hypothetical protein Q9165_004997 [Trypethelium subeluteriae]